MQVEVNHLHRLVEDLFTLASLDSGASILNLAEYTLGEIVEETLTVSNPLADSAQVKLETDIDNPSSKVICDRSRIAQVLLGFVDNALKHTPAGGKITIFAHPNQGKMEVGVTDTGSGIPTHMSERIFDRFYHYSAKKPEKKGTGLGLSIAKEILEAHGSEIKVKSAPGQGSTFSFTLKIPS
jgi:two-component system phosphate regulon sensor histidine kinase PhoR